MPGVPICVLQEDKTTKFTNQEYRGNVKESEMKGDDKLPELITAHIYGTKTINFLSMEYNELNWMTKTKISW